MGNPQGPFHSANVSAPALPSHGGLPLGSWGRWARPWEPEGACTPQQGGIRQAGSSAEVAGAHRKVSRLGCYPKGW